MKSSAFRALTHSPLNGAPSPEALLSGPVTSAEDFFVRNHGDVPAPQPVALQVTGLVRNPFRFVGGAFPRVRVEATLQCAGNRRTGLQRLRPIPNEVPWTNEAISNAVWEGIPLSAILERAGVTDEAAHVWFTGNEPLIGKHAGEQFGASIPLEKAMSDGVILADRMNDAPLPPEHGAPLRALVPGYIGARSVKWLSEIRVERIPSTNHFQRAYSVFPSTTLAVPPNHEGGIVLGELPLNSAFGWPGDDTALPEGVTTVRGWAMAGGDRVVERVEVSADAGASWTPAHFDSTPKRFVWALWRCELNLRRGAHELACRAFDSSGSSQPADVADVWNVKGYANNSWDRVCVKVG